MCTIYSPLTVGALGISNNLGGITTNPQNGFQEGGSAIISQRLGAGLPKRALEAFRCILIINFSRVFIFRVPVLWGLQQFTDLGDISAGIVMAVSNIATGVLAVIVGWITIRQIKKQYGI